MTGQAGVIVTLDGEVHPPGTPLLFADDLAAVHGDGVFEALLVRAGGACLVEAHLGRLSHSAKLLDLPEPDLAGWRHAIDLAARRWAASSRLVWVLGSILIAGAAARVGLRSGCFSTSQVGIPTHRAKNVTISGTSIHIHVIVDSSVSA